MFEGAYDPAFPSSPRFVSAHKNDENQVMTQYKLELKNNCGKPITKHMPFIIVVAFHININ
jgi:hypothetical protein